MEKAPQQILAQLYALQDLDYRAFHMRLIPTVSPQRVLGVRIPALRAMARQLAGSREADVFLSCLPHRYYEEDNLHVLLLERERDFSAALMGVEAFLPYIDNWLPAICPRRGSLHGTKKNFCRMCADGWLLTRHTRYGMALGSCSDTIWRRLSPRKCWPGQQISPRRSTMCG